MNDKALDRANNIKREIVMYEKYRVEIKNSIKNKVCQWGIHTDLFKTILKMVELEVEKYFNNIIDELEKEYKDL